MSEQARKLSPADLQSVTGGAMVSAKPEAGITCPICGGASVDCKISGGEDGPGLRVYRCRKCEYLWTP